MSTNCNGNFSLVSCCPSLLRPLPESGGHRLAVDARVLGQVVGPREPFAARVAAVRLDARVRATVSGQLIGPGEAPRAARPHAAVRFLARMPSHVHLRKQTPPPTGIAPSDFVGTTVNFATVHCGGSRPFRGRDLLNRIAEILDDPFAMIALKSCFYIIVIEIKILSTWQIRYTNV